MYTRVERRINRNGLVAYAFAISSVEDWLVRHGGYRDFYGG